MGVLVAHPERSAEGLEHLRPAMVAGALLQVDACSLLGRHGPQARRIAERMLLDGSAYVLASDGHGASRNHTLRAGRDAAVAAGVSVTRAAQLTRANPRFLLEHGLPGTARGDAAATSWWPSSTRS
jgi:protein-tyrosine phosphatase